MIPCGETLDCSEAIVALVVPQWHMRRRPILEGAAWRDVGWRTRYWPLDASGRNGIDVE